MTCRTLLQGGGSLLLQQGRPQSTVAYISDAYRLLSPAVGTVAAKIIFGIALLASGQNSTITGTLAGDLLGSQPLTSLTCFNSCWSRLMGEWAYVQGKW